MANIRKLWAIKTSLRGIANTESSPDMVVPDSFYWTEDPSTGNTPAYRYYTGGGYTTDDPSPFLWSVKNTFYEDSPRSEYNSYYGTLQEFDFTAYFRRNQLSANKYFPYDKVYPSFDMQILGRDPYYDVAYTTIDGTEISSNFQKFFTSSLIQPFVDDTYSGAQNSYTPPYAGGALPAPLKGYGWWYRNSYLYPGSSSLILSSTQAMEQVRYASTVPSVNSLQANYYIQSWKTDTSAVWNEYEGATVTPSVQIPYLDKFWFGGTISDSEKEQMAMKGKPRLAAPSVAPDSDGTFNDFTPAEPNPLYQAGGTNIAFEIELALHRYGAAYIQDSSTNVFGVDYVAGNFAFDSVGYAESGGNLLVPCYVTLEANEANINVSNMFGTSATEKTVQVNRGHLKKYVIVSIRLEQAFNAESFVPGSGIVLNPEDLPGTVAYGDQVLGGFGTGGFGSMGRSDSLFPLSNYTNIVLNNASYLTTPDPLRGPVNCFRFGESGEDWFYTGGTRAPFDLPPVSYPNNKRLFRANGGTYNGTAYESGTRNKLFLGTQVDPALNRQIYATNNVFQSTFPYQASPNNRVDTSNRVDYSALESDLDFKIQSFQWSNCGLWLYILYTSGAQPNTSSSSYVYQWVERYRSVLDSGKGYDLNELEWSGSTDIYYKYGDGDPNYPTLYPAHSINVTPDGQYLQVLFDYFSEGHPTISEHFLGGDPHLMVSPEAAGQYSHLSQYSGLSRSTNPYCYEEGNVSISQANRIKWPVTTVLPGYVGDNLTTAQIDAGQTEIYLRMGTAYYTVDDFEYAYQRRNSTGTDAQETIKTWPTDFAWTVDGSCLYLFGFLDRTRYADQYPSAAPASYGMWELNDGAPVLWKVRLYQQRAQSTSNALPQYPGNNPDTLNYPNSEGHPYLYNNRIYWNWRHHQLNKSVGLESGGAPYYPTNTSKNRNVQMKLKKASFSGSGRTEYLASPSFGTQENYLTVGNYVFSRSTIAMVENTVDYATASSPTDRGIAFNYRFDLSDSSMSGDGINVYDNTGTVWTQGVTFTGTPGTSGAYMTITLDPFAGSYPSVLYVYGSAASGPSDTLNPGFYINPRQVPKFHWVTGNLTENGFSNTGNIWPEYPIRKKTAVSYPVNAAYSIFADNTQPAVFNLAKNGRFLSIACAILDGNVDGSSSEVQRINTWMIEENGSENYVDASTSGTIGSNEYIGDALSSNSPIAPYSGNSSWGNSIHFSIGEGVFTYTPVYREKSVGRSAQQWRLSKAEVQTEGLLTTDRLSRTQTSFSEVGTNRLNQKLDFDWQDETGSIAADGGFLHWPYVVTLNAKKDPLAVFSDVRGGFNSLWFVAPQRTTYGSDVNTYTGWQQSGLFYYGKEIQENSRYSDGPFQKRVPLTLADYNEKVATGRFLDLSDNPATLSYDLNSPSINGTLQKYHLLNGTSIASNWSNSRIDVPPFKFRARESNRSLSSEGASQFSVSYMELMSTGNGSNFSAVKKSSNGPNMTQAAFAYENSGRVELEVPYTFDSYTTLDATFPATLRTLEYTSDQSRPSPAQVRSIRFLNGGNKFAVLLSGELGTYDGFSVGSPSFSVFMYDATEPYSIENATLDKSFTYSNAESDFYTRSWWSSYERFAGTYYGSDFVFKPDGTKMWVLGIESSATGFPIRPYQCKLVLYEFDLSTAFDLSTVSSNGSATYANIAHNGTNIELPDNLEVSPDGLNVYWGTHSPYTSSEAILHYQSTLPNAYDLKNPDQDSTRSFSYQGVSLNIVSKGVPMYAYEGAGQMMRFVGDNPNRWYRTNYANPAIGTETTPANPATGTTEYNSLFTQPYGGCSVFEKDGRKYQKSPSRVSVGNMGMFPTRPFLGEPGSGDTGLSYNYGTGRRSAVAKFDKFIFAVDPEETTMVVSDGQRWLYQLLFNNDSGVKGS